MSERKGGAHASKRVQVNISGEFGDRLTALSQSSKMNKKDMVEFFIELSEKYGFHKPGWAQRLNKSLDLVDHEEVHEEYEAMTGKCQCLAHGDSGYLCVYYRVNKPPLIRKLSLTTRGAEKICEACHRTREIIEGIAHYEEQIEALKSEVGRGIVVKLPSCNQGGALSSDGKKLFCRHPKRSFQSRSVEKWCKVLRSGANCESLRWTTLSVKGKFTELER